MAWVEFVFLAFRESLLDRCLQLLVALAHGIPQEFGDLRGPASPVMTFLSILVRITANMMPIRVNWSLKPYDVSEHYREVLTVEKNAGGLDRLLRIMVEGVLLVSVYAEFMTFFPWEFTVWS